MQGQNESKGGPYAGWAFGVLRRRRPPAHLAVLRVPAARVPARARLLRLPRRRAERRHLADHRHDRHPAPRSSRCCSGASSRVSSVSRPEVFWAPACRRGRPSGAATRASGRTSRTWSAAATTWLDFVFLVLKFPVGIVSFVLCVTGLSIVVAFIGAPFMQQFGWFTIAGERVDSWPLALALVPVGILALFVWLHVMNAWGYVSARLAEALLVDEPEKRAEAAAAQPPASPAPQAQAPVPPWQAPPQPWQQPWQQQPWQQQPWRRRPHSRRRHPAGLAAAGTAAAAAVAAAGAACSSAQPWPPQAWPAAALAQPGRRRGRRSRGSSSPGNSRGGRRRGRRRHRSSRSRRRRQPQAPEAPQQPPAEAEAGPAANEPSDDN